MMVFIISTDSGSVSSTIDENGIKPHKETKTEIPTGAFLLAYLPIIEKE